MVKANRCSSILSSLASRSTDFEIIMSLKNATKKDTQLSINYPMHLANQEVRKPLHIRRVMVT